MRKLVHVVPISIALLILLMAVSPALASRGPTVSILGGNVVKINQRLLSTYHFGPGTLHVMSGELVTFQNTAPCAIDCDHTISIVNVSQLPENLTQIFPCLIDQPGTICVTIIGAHFPQGPGGPANPRVNVPGEPSGFQGANSLLIAKGQTLEVTITAQSGTTIQFMCAFHPWNAGKHHSRERRHKLRSLRLVEQPGLQYSPFFSFAIRLPSCPFWCLLLIVT